VDAILQSRGYSTTKYNALQTSYYNRPTPYQQLCYDAYVLKLVKQTEHDPTKTSRSNFHALKQLFQAGMSSNPCNAHGESLLHTICRLGTGNDQTLSSTTTSVTTPSSWSYELLQLMISIGKCDVSNCVDDYGRTPLHDACWCNSICYDTISLLLQQDPTLILLQDCRGATPLSYIPVQHHTTFIEFISQYKDQFFPDIRTNIGNGSHKDVVFPSKLVRDPPHGRPVPDPKNALSPDVARMVVSGRITPQELTFLLLQDHDDDDNDDDDDEESESSYDDDDDDEEYDDDDDELVDEEDDSSTILSAEGDAFLPPKKLNTRHVATTRNVISDEDDFAEGSDEEESYSDLDEMLQRLKCPNHMRSSNAGVNTRTDDFEAVLGIGRPQYGYELMNTSSKQDRLEQKQSSNKMHSTTSTMDHHDDELCHENCASATDYVKPMASVNIPTITLVDTSIQSIVPTTRITAPHPNSSPTKPSILDNHQHHPILEMTNELLEFSV
jgi:hypothetical protein